MAIEHTDIIKIRSEQTLDGETILNIYYFVTALFSAGVTLLELLTEFRDTVITPIRALQHVDLTHTLLHAENLTNGLDEETLVLNLAGTDSAGEALNTFTAIGFKLLVDSKLTRNGSKRYAGASEGRVQGNTYIAGAGEDTAVATALATVLEVSGTPSGESDFFPAIIRRDPVLGLVLADWNVILSAAVRGNITSQTSRKQVV